MYEGAILNTLPLIDGSSTLAPNQIGCLGGVNILLSYR